MAYGEFSLYYTDIYLPKAGMRIAKTEGDTMNY